MQIEYQLYVYNRDGTIRKVKKYKNGRLIK